LACGPSACDVGRLKAAIETVKVDEIFSAIIAFLRSSILAEPINPFKVYRVLGCVGGYLKQIVIQKS
jgi:hypothetical protein